MKDSELSWEKTRSDFLEKTIVCIESISSPEASSHPVLRGAEGLQEVDPVLLHSMSHGQGSWGLHGDLVPFFMGLGQNNWAFQSHFCFLLFTLVLAFIIWPFYIEN